MKKQKSILLYILATGLSINTYAQFTGGGSGGDNRQVGQKTVTKVGSVNDIFRQTNGYFRIGFSSPVGSFADEPSSKINTLKQIYDGNAGVGAKTGFTFEGGFISYFDDLPLAEQFKAGLDLSFAYSHNKPDWTHWNNGWEDAEYLPFLFFESKIGPAISYNPIGSLVVDAYFKLCPLLSYGGNISMSEENASTSYSYYIDGGLGSGIKKALGFNIKQNKMVLGLEMNLGRINYNITEYYYIMNKSNYTSDSDTDTFEGKAPTGTIRCTFGLCF